MTDLDRLLELKEELNEETGYFNHEKYYVPLEKEFESLKSKIEGLIDKSEFNKDFESYMKWCHGFDDLQSQVANRKEMMGKMGDEMLNMNNQIAKLKEEVRQGKFRLADEQDSHSHVECNEVIAKLKEKNRDTLFALQDEALFGMKVVEENTKLKEELETYINAESKEINQLKSTLDEIKTLFNSWLDGNTNLGNFCTEYKEITAKHENDKNE